MYRTYEELKLSPFGGSTFAAFSLYRTYEELKRIAIKSLVSCLVMVCIVPMRN